MMFRLMKRRYGVEGIYRPNISWPFLSSALTFLIEVQVEELKELSKKPDIYDRLTRSLAPNIWELDDVKKGLLCQVFSTFLLLPFPASF